MRPDPPSSPAEAATADPAQIARGGYLATVTGCILCHTPTTADGAPDRARLLAGGLEVKPGQGVWRSPNITPDRATGIGAWTDAELAAAIRVGVRPGGTRLLPIMPYPFYHRMTDADVRAIIAFLRAQPPIANAVRRSEGLDMRPVKLQEPAGNVDPAGDPRGHGEYIASLLHCGACHTPQAGPLARTPFAGGMPFGLPDGTTIFSSNITSDPDTGIGRWTEAQLLQTLRTMQRPDGTPLRGPMTVYQGAWSHLDERDARALAVYVKSIAPVRNEVRDRTAAVTGAR
jgi:mono/diheme cytochrome c family protein